MDLSQRRMVKETLYRFGPYVLNPVERVLRRNGTLVPIPPKALSTLLVLVAARGRVISKDELVTGVWPDSFVEDGNLTQYISLLRKTLSPDFPDAGPIETIPRVGYRFRPEVQVDATPPTPPEALPQSPANTPSNHAKTRWLWLLALPFLLIAALFFFRSREKSHNQLALTLTRFTSKASEDRITATAIAPDGHLIAYADADGVVLQSIGSLDTHPLHTPPMKRMSYLAWFPDGLHLALSGTAPSGKPQVWILSVVGEAPTLFRDDASLAVPSPDGSLVAFTSGSGNEVWFSGPAGEHARQLLSGVPQDKFTAILWSKTGKILMIERERHVAQRALFPPGSQEALHGFHAAYLALDVASGKTTASIDGMRFTNACLLKEDQLLFSRSEPTTGHDGSTTLWTVHITPSTGAFSSAPQKIKDIPGFNVLTFSKAVQDGEIAAVLTQGHPEVHVASLTWPGPRLGDVRRLSLDTGVAYPHSWTADSSSVLYESDHGGRSQIYQQQLDRHDPKAIVTTTDLQSRPRLTPDGHWVLFSSRISRDAPDSLFRSSLQNGTPIPVNGVGPRDDYRCPTVGKTCILRSIQDHSRIIFSALDPMSGKGADLFTAPFAWLDAGDWDISSDGTTLALISSTSALPLVRTVQLATGKVQEIPVNIESPITTVNWAADQKGWFLSTPTATGSDLFYVDLQGRPTLLRQIIGPTWGVPSPDGKKLAFVDQNVDQNVWLLHQNKSE